MEHEYHATEFVPMSSDDVCRVLACDGASILASATEMAAERLLHDSAGGPDSDASRRLQRSTVVAGALEQERRCWATIGMHWLTSSGTGDDLTAWLRGELHIMPRRADLPVLTELLLCVRCDAPEPLSRDGGRVVTAELVGEFLQTVAEQVRARMTDAAPAMTAHPS